MPVLSGSVWGVVPPPVSPGTGHLPPMIAKVGCGWDAGGMATSRTAGSPPWTRHRPRYGAAGPVSGWCRGARQVIFSRLHSAVPWIRIRSV